MASATAPAAASDASTASLSTWQPVQLKDGVTLPKVSGSACAQFEDGTALSFGGVGDDGYLSDVFEFNAASPSSVSCRKLTDKEMKGAVPPPLAYPAATAVDNNTFAMFGGVGGIFEYVPWLSFFDRATLTWTRYTPPASSSKDAEVAGNAGDEAKARELWPSGRCSAALAYAPSIVREGDASKTAAPSLLLFGGVGDKFTFNNALWVFDTKTKQWWRPTVSALTDSNDVPLPRTGAAVVVAANHLWLYGGKDKSSTYFDGLFALDLQTWKWRRVSLKNNLQPPNVSGSALHALGVPNANAKQLLLFGGVNKQSAYNDSWVFDIEGGAWNRVSTESEAKQPAAATGADPKPSTQPKAPLGRGQMISALVAPRKVIDASSDCKAGAPGAANPSQEPKSVPVDAWRLLVACGTDGHVDYGDVWQLNLRL